MRNPVIPPCMDSNPVDYKALLIKYMHLLYCTGHPDILTGHRLFSRLFTAGDQKVIATLIQEATYMNCPLPPFYARVAGRRNTFDEVDISTILQRREPPVMIIDDPIGPDTPENLRQSVTWLYEHLANRLKGSSTNPWVLPDDWEDFQRSYGVINQRARVEPEDIGHDLRRAIYTYEAERNELPAGIKMHRLLRQTLITYVKTSYNMAASSVMEFMGIPLTTDDTLPLKEIEFLNPLPDSFKAPITGG